MQQKLYGGIEFGGTKTICAIGTADGQITRSVRIATTTVDETLAAIYEFFEGGGIVALGIGAFGPINLDESSPEFGSMRNVPKPGWTGAAIKRILESRLKVPVQIDTDVDCAALGELYCGVGQSVDSLVYVTVGTGIGAGIILDRKIHHGIHNTEAGHIRVPHEPFEPGFQGVCPYHQDCLEGIASGPAMQARYGQPATDITNEDAWQREAQYIAMAVHDFTLSLGPEMIVLGGGVSKHPGLIEDIRRDVQQSMNGYLDLPDLERYIVLSSGDDNGAQGALKLASLGD